MFAVIYSNITSTSIRWFNGVIRPQICPLLPKLILC
jgi:hypothetical protein